jgi:uncharacterized protein YndB with AHSA1/START domain
MGVESFDQRSSDHRRITGTGGPGVPGARLFALGGMWGAGGAKPRSTKMKWVLIGTGAVLALVALMALIGSRLPRGHTATKSARFAVPPDVVWSAITDVEAFPSWRSDVKNVTVMPDQNGRKRWIEETRSGRIPLTLDRADSPRLLVVRIADPDLPFGGTWTYEVAPAPDGSTLTITENGEVYNPIFRFMARFVFGHEATTQTYLANLQKRMAAQRS